MKNSENFTIINSYMNYDKKENCFKSINQIKKVNILLNEPEMNLSKIWLILLIIFSIGFIIGIIYYFCNKKKKIDDSNLIYNFAKFHEF